MAALYVGQRVRKVRGAANVGRDGVVVALDPTDIPDASVAVAYSSDAVGYWFGLEMAVRAGTPLWTNPDKLEPIVPEGLESLCEIDELYEPAPAMEAA